MKAIAIASSTAESMTNRPDYLRVFLTFVRNSLVRDMMFRANFIIETISSFGWVMMNLGFYLLIFNYTSQIGAGSRRRRGWDKYQFFVFIATTMFINSIVQMFFMPNAEEFSELIRTGGLDFALLKPIDTQFLISLRKVDWSSLANFVRGGRADGLRAAAARRISRSSLLAVAALSALRRARRRDPVQPDDRARGHERLAGPQLSRSTTSGSTSRTSRATRWRFTTARSAAGSAGRFTFVLPVLVVVNVPARMLAKPLQPEYCVPGRVRDRRHRRQPRRQPLGVSAGAVELSQREQLSRIAQPVARTRRWRTHTESYL